MNKTEGIPYILRFFDLNLQKEDRKGYMILASSDH